MAAQRQATIGFRIIRDSAEEQAFSSQHHVCYIDSRVLRELKQFVIINDEKDLFFLKLKTFKNDKVEFELMEELAGCNDLVMDLRFMKMKDLEDSRNDLLVVASNSDKLRIVNLQNKSNLFAVGHTDMIMCVDTREEHILSGSKDCTIKIWRVDLSETSVNSNLLNSTSNLTSNCCVPSEAIRIRWCQFSLILAMELSSCQDLRTRL